MRMRSTGGTGEPDKGFAIYSSLSLSLLPGVVARAVDYERPVGDLHLVRAPMAVGLVRFDYSALVPSALDRGTRSGERPPSRSGRAAEVIRA